MDSAASGIRAFPFLTHTLTHNRKSASGRGGLFGKQNRQFPSHTARSRLEITLFFLQSDFGTKRPCVQVTSLRPVKEPGNRVFMRFPGAFVYLWFPMIFAADPYRDPYGIWAGGFWPLGLFPFLCSGHFVPLCSIWVAALLGPDTCPERPHAGVLWVWAVVFSPRFPPSFRSEIGGFFSLKRNDLQFFATRVRIRHGGDFPGIK